jgi:hypothetical protein
MPFTADGFFPHYYRRVNIHTLSPKHTHKVSLSPFDLSQEGNYSPNGPLTSRYMSFILAGANHEPASAFGSTWLAYHGYQRHCLVRLRHEYKFYMLLPSTSLKSLIESLCHIFDQICRKHGYIHQQRRPTFQSGHVLIHACHKVGHELANLTSLRRGIIVYGPNKSIKYKHKCWC